MQAFQTHYISTFICTCKYYYMTSMYLPYVGVILSISTCMRMPMSSLHLRCVIQPISIFYLHTYACVSIIIHVLFISYQVYLFCTIYLILSISLFLYIFFFLYPSFCTSYSVYIPLSVYLNNLYYRSCYFFFAIGSRFNVEENQKVLKLKTIETKPETEMLLAEELDKTRFGSSRHHPNVD